MKRQIDAICIGSYSKINTSKENDINIRNLSKVEDVFTLLSDPKFNADTSNQLI